MITKEQIDSLLAGKANVVGSDGEKIGSVGQVYLDDTTGNPSWVTANTGLFGLSETFIPLDGAQVSGDEVRVPYTKDRVKDAPNLDPDGHISEDEQDRLYEYYGLAEGSGVSGNTQGTYAGTDAGTYTETTTSREGAGYSAAQGTESDLAAGFGHDGQRDDEGSLTRSEEQVNVGTERREAGRVRLRKYVVTENVTQTVPVSREEVRVEREPITDADRVGNADLGEDVQEVTLHEETPVVEKETVPVEKVRLEKDTVTDEETVNTDVRKEKIETDTTDDRGI